MAVVAAAMFVSPAGAATVTLHPPYVAQDLGDEDEDGYIDVTDVGSHRNNLEVRTSERAVVVVERGRRQLNTRGGCRRRSAHVVVCRVRTPDNTVYVDTGGSDDVVRGSCAPGDVSIDGGSGNDRLFSDSCP